MTVKFPTLSRDRNNAALAADDENVEFDTSKVNTNNSSPCNLKASQRKGRCQVQSMNLFNKGNELFSHRNAFYIKAAEEEVVPPPPFEKPEVDDQQYYISSAEDRGHKRLLRSPQEDSFLNESIEVEIEDQLDRVPPV